MRRQPSFAAACSVSCPRTIRSEEHTSELQSPCNLVCRLLLEKKKKKTRTHLHMTPSRKRAVSSPRYLLGARLMRAALVCGYVFLCLTFAFLFFFFFFNDTATTEIYTLSLHDALPIYFFDVFEIAVFRFTPGGAH